MAPVGVNSAYVANSTDVLSASKPNLESFLSLESIGITDSQQAYVMMTKP